MAYEPDPEHRRPEHADDTAVEAAGKLTEALELVERARGHLYTFHQLTGRADFALDTVTELLDKAGQGDLAERIRRDLIGLDVIKDRWTFQIVEDYDAGYYATFRALESEVRDRLMDGRRHVAEAELKQRRTSS
ncbi:hypothetical protein ACIBEJ_29370 [Nonomuraea sp. NPDC050790]|uniref:hypothetical protein n=1 Tax=Nonomuraea sp. NPDC050790 TaxID=3364371 RepID=UPI0037AB9EF0